MADWNVSGVLVSFSAYVAQFSTIGEFSACTLYDEAEKLYLSGVRGVRDRNVAQSERRIKMLVSLQI
jgi:hypothetical protein